LQRLSTRKVYVRHYAELVPAPDASLPDLRNTIVVAAFEGWNDAGDAATDALEHLDAMWEAETIVDRQVVAFQAWLKARSAVPAIVQLRARADEYRAAELAPKVQAAAQRAAAGDGGPSAGASRARPGGTGVRQ